MRVFPADVDEPVDECEEHEGERRGGLLAVGAVRVLGDAEWLVHSFRGE